MKPTSRQQAYLDHIRTHGTPRGLTLGRGRPTDRKVVQSLIDAGFVMPVFSRDDVMQDTYAIRGDEDANGLALYEEDGVVVAASHYGVLVRPFSNAEYRLAESGPAIQNGSDTARELYPNDEVRREWMMWAAARSTLAMLLGA